MKKKLLITASTFPRWEGDTEPRFILDYAKAMNAYYDVTVLAPAAMGVKDYEVLESVKIIRYHYFPIHSCETLCYPGAILPRIKQKIVRVFLVPPLILALYRTLKKICKEYDIVHSNWIIPQGIVQSTIKEVPYIITGHGGDISSFNNGLIKKYKKKCLEKAEKVVVVSKYKQDELKKIFPDIKSEIISMGVNTFFFNKNENYIANYFGQNNRKVILYVGRLAEIKGVRYLIDSLQYTENILLIIVGDGPIKEELEKCANHFKDSVIFWGSKSHYELKNIYASADILVVPSVIDKAGAQEGLPTVILEAFASGLPVIATKTGGIQDLIIDRENGFLVNEKSSLEIGNAINTLISEKKLYYKIVTEEIKTSLKYDYRVIAKKYYDLLEEI